MRPGGNPGRHQAVCGPASARAPEGAVGGRYRTLQADVQGGGCPTRHHRMKFRAPNIDFAANYVKVAQRAGHAVVVASGYLNPLHVGHIRYFRACVELGTILIVVVNNDRQVALKGSCQFMSEMERLEIVNALDMVDLAVLAIDDDRSVCKTLELLQPDIFANGGDVRSSKDCREAEVCR